MSLPSGGVLGKAGRKKTLKEITLPPLGLFYRGQWQGLEDTLVFWCPFAPPVAGHSRGKGEGV